MAKIIFFQPVKSVSGKFGKNDKVIYLTRRAATSNPDMIANPCYTAVQGQRSTTPSESELAQRAKFGQICKAVSTRLVNTTQMAKDQAAFKAQSTYKTLRQYVWHAVADSME